MTDWYYHAPGQGRVGPLSADEMRQRYRDRTIALDTLAWHEGLREWQPLERLIEELGLTGVQPDMSKPPPPPPPRPAAGMASHAARANVAMAPPPSKRNGCLIALLVVGVLGLVLMAILAAIALPAYQDYVKRAKAAQIRQTGGDGRFDAARLDRTEGLARELVTAAMRTSYVANGNRCPEEYEFEQVLVRESRLQGDDDGWFSLDPTQPAGGVCAYRVEFRGLGPETKGHAVQYEVVLDGDDVRISCHNLDMPVGAIPSRCGA